MVWAQSPVAGSPYVISAFTGFNNVLNPHASGGLAIGRRVVNDNTMALLVIEQRGAVTTTSAEVLQPVINDKRGFTLFVLGDAGVASSNTGLGFNFAPGGGISGDLMRIFNKPSKQIGWFATAKLDHANLAPSDPLSGKTEWQINVGLSFGFGDPTPAVAAKRKARAAKFARP